MLQVLNSPAIAEQYFARWGLHDTNRALLNLQSLAQHSLPDDLSRCLFEQLNETFAAVERSWDGSQSLRPLFQAARSPLSLATLFERDATALPALLQIFSASQYLSDLLINDPASYDLLRLSEGEPVSREILVQEFA